MEPAPKRVIWPRLAGLRPTILHQLTRGWLRAAPIRTAARSWLSNALLPTVAGTLLVSLLGFFTYSFTGVRSYEDAVRWVGSHFAEPVTPGRFIVLLADLERDDQLGTTAFVADALSAQPGLTVVLRGRALELLSVGDQTAALEKAREIGRRWLEEAGADLLIWGGVYGDVFRLRFLSPADASITDTYRLDDIEVTRKVHEHLATQLRAVVLAQIAPATEQAGHYLVELLKPAADKLRHLLDHPPPGLTRSQLAELQDNFGITATVLGEQTGEKAWLEEAVAAYKAAVAEHTRERTPLHWAVKVST